MPAPELTSPILDYAARGWPVLPIYGLRDGVCTCRAGKRCESSQGKHPLTRNGVHDASLDVATITAWSTRHPGCNWAIATGHPLPDGGHLVVLDVDPRNGGDEQLRALEREHGELPRTATQISGGNGQHYLFRAPTAMPGAVLAEGIEFKGTGGYVLVHPSSHVSGRTYEWDAGAHPDDTRIAELPAWIVERLAERHRTRPETTGDDAASTLLGTAFRLAGWLGGALPEGRRMVRCPWADEHSDDRGRGEDSSTVLLPPRADSNFGGFKCQHAHCTSRGWKSVLKALPPDALAQARAEHRPRPAEPAPPSVSSVPAAPAAAPTWRERLVYRQTKNGAALEKCSANAVTILRNDPAWAGKIRYDEFAECTRVTDPPWAEDDRPASSSDEWRDSDDVRLQAWLMRSAYALDIPITMIAQAVEVVAQSNPYHDVRAYLGGLQWDGVARIDRWLTTYLGAADTEYTRAVGQRWLVSAVARVFEPGCQADSALVLEGPQGAGKSTALEALASQPWFSDSQLAIGTADGYAGLRGRWIVEMGELDALRGRAMSAVKNYLSARSDYYRVSYGRRFATHLRQCVFAGSTNEHQYLNDPTGARRFHVVAVGKIDVPAVRRDRDQLWAEAVIAYRNGCPWHLDTPHLRQLAAEEAEARMQSDPWEVAVERYLRRVDTRQGVLTHDVLLALEIDSGKQTKADEMRIANVLRALGYERGPQHRENGNRVRRYFKAVTER